MELDHLFIVVRDDGPRTSSKARAAGMSAALCRAGLRESFSRTHDGQGTANHRFQFDNALIELLYIQDREQLSTPPTTALQLEARFMDSDASPFGICSRPDPSGPSEAVYPHSLYKPSYLPPDLAIQFADGLPASEPLWFHLPFARRPDASGGEDRAHPLGVRRVAGVRLESRTSPSARSKSIAGHLGIDISLSSRDHMHLHVESSVRQTARSSLTPDPDLPLTLHW